MGNFTGHEIRKTYDRVLQNQHGQIHNGLGQEVSASIHTLHVNNNFTVGGNVIVSGSITAQSFHTEFVSASTIFESGSTQFGDSPGDIHTMIGTLQHSGEYRHTGNTTETGTTYKTGDTNQTGSIQVAGGNIVANPGVFMNPSTYSSNVFVPEYFNAGMYGPISNAATIQVSNHSKLRIFP